MPLTRIGRWKVHSVIELDYQQGHEVEQKDPNIGTQIENGSSLVSLENGVTCYSPELKGFVKEKTSALYYKTNEDGTVDDTPEIKPITEYLQTNKTYIEKDGSKYEFYNYKSVIKENGSEVLDSIWANIKVERDGLESYWVWIPRYAYKILENDKTEIVYIDIQNNIAGTTNKAEDSGYIIHSAFIENNKKGIWISKYEPQHVVEDKMQELPYYIPDVKGFDREKTYIEIYKDDGTFEDVKLSTINNLAEFAEKNRWFDYEKQIWANIKIYEPESQTETWWVWIPRYAYNISGDETKVIFLDTEDNPLTGEDLPSNYVVHSAFEGGKKGIWVSKYEVSQEVVDIDTTNNVNLPDMSGFDPDTTYVEVYKDDGTFNETKLSDISNISQFATANRWYDYSKQIWANIKIYEPESQTETWWVWIPRYAYNISGDEIRIIFLDENGNPKDGSSLPANYVPHPGFEGKKGIWVSKYEVSEK